MKEVKGLLEKKSVQIWDFILHRFISWTDYPINLELIFILKEKIFRVSRYLEETRKSP